MRLHFLVPGNIKMLTGGYVYDRKLSEAASKSGFRVMIHELSAEFPFPSAAELDRCRRIFKKMEEGVPVLIDSLALAPLAGLLEERAGKNPFMAVMHIALTYSPDLDPGQRSILREHEKSALSLVNRVLATSRYTAGLIRNMGIPEEKITIIHPGTGPGKPKTSYSARPAKLLCVGSYVPNKGHAVLFHALHKMKDRTWQLDCYGEKILNPSYTRELMVLIDELHLTGRIILHGPVVHPLLTRAYLSADLLVHPSGQESYGMVPAEALFYGLPVVTTTGGALPETVPADMGKFFIAGDTTGLYNLLSLLMDDEQEYRRLCRNASQYHLNANTWDKSCELFIKVIGELVPEARK